MHQYGSECTAVNRYETDDPIERVGVAADFYARHPRPEHRNAHKAAVRDLVHHLTVQRDFAVRVAGELAKDGAA